MVKGKISVKHICYCALFTALSVIANTFTVNFGLNGSNAISFNYTVCFFAGAFLGPLVGFISGACGDILGWLINPSGGAFNPVITLISGTIGLISGLIFYIAKRKDKQDKLISLTVISYIFIFLICTNLNTVSMYFYYMQAKYSFWAYYVMRTSKQVIFWALNLAISVLLIKPLKKLLKI